MDFFIRFEQLYDDVARVCERLSIPFVAEQILEFKKGDRVGKSKIREYYDEETRRLVEELYAWEMERFGCRMSEY